MEKGKSKINLKIIIPIVVFICIFVILLVINVVKKEDNSTNMDNKNKIEEYKDSMYNSKAKIVKSDKLNDMKVSLTNAEVSIESYDLGYSGHSLTKGKEVLCLKLHIKNTSNNVLEIQNLFKSDIYIDGVERTAFISDFYGNDVAYNTQFSSKLRPQSETDIYFSIDCSVNEKHKIDVDFHDMIENEGYSFYSYIEDIVKSFSFSIE